MSIAAIIERVERNADGTATLHLGPIARDDGPGQARLTVLGRPAGLEAAVGTRIWGSDSSIMVAGTKWADRIGYTQIRLVGT